MRLSIIHHDLSSDFDVEINPLHPIQAEMELGEESDGKPGSAPARESQVGSLIPYLQICNAAPYL